MVSEDKQSTKYKKRKYAELLKAKNGSDKNKTFLEYLFIINVIISYLFTKAFDANMRKVIIYDSTLCFFHFSIDKTDIICLF